MTAPAAPRRRWPLWPLLWLLTVVPAQRLLTARAPSRPEPDAIVALVKPTGELRPGSEQDYCRELLAADPDRVSVPECGKAQQRLDMIAIPLATARATPADR